MPVHAAHVLPGQVVVVIRDAFSSSIWAFIIPDASKLSFHLWNHELEFSHLVLLFLNNLLRRFLTTVLNIQLIIIILTSLILIIFASLTKYSLISLPQLTHSLIVQGKTTSKELVYLLNCFECFYQFVGVCPALVDVLCCDKGTHGFVDLPPLLSFLRSETPMVVVKESSKHVKLILGPSLVLSTALLVPPSFPGLLWVFQLSQRLDPDIVSFTHEK